MCFAHEQAAWIRGAILASWIINRSGLAKELVDPRVMVPAAYRPPPEPEREKTPEEIESESKRAWHVLDSFFGNPP